MQKAYVLFFIQFNDNIIVLAHSQTKPPAKVRETQGAGNQYVTCRWKNISQPRTKTFIEKEHSRRNTVL